MKPSKTIPPELMGKTHEEIAAALGVSRQYVHILMRKAAGFCLRCNNKPTNGVLCTRCAERRRKKVRASKGHKPWTPGKRGRPPLDRKE